MNEPDPTSWTDKIRSAEKKLLKEFVKWKQKRGGGSPLNENTLEQSAEKTIDHAHRIIKKTGIHLWEEVKNAKDELVKAYREETKK